MKQQSDNLNQAISTTGYADLASRMIDGAWLMDARLSYWRKQRTKLPRATSFRIAIRRRVNSVLLYLTDGRVTTSRSFWLRSRARFCTSHNPIGRSK